MAVLEAIGMLHVVPTADETIQRLTAIPGRPPDLLDPPEGCRFAARCPYANEFDGCATHMPALRELRPGHIVRSEHPTTERARRKEAAPA